MSIKAAALCAILYITGSEARGGRFGRGNGGFSAVASQQWNGPRSGISSSMSGGFRGRRGQQSGGQQSGGQQSGVGFRGGRGQQSGGGFRGGRGQQSGSNRGGRFQEKREEKKQELQAVCPNQVAFCEALADGSGENSFGGKRAFMECLLEQPAEGECADLLSNIQEKIENGRGGRGGRGHGGRGRGRIVGKVNEMLEACSAEIQEVCAMDLLAFDMDLNQLQATLEDHAQAAEAAKEAGERPERLAEDVKDMLKAVRNCFKDDVRPGLEEGSQCFEALPGRRPHRPYGNDGDDELESSAAIEKMFT